MIKYDLFKDRLDSLHTKATETVNVLTLQSIMDEYKRVTDEMLYELGRKNDNSELIYRVMEDGRKINIGFMLPNGTIYYYDETELAKNVPYEFSLSAMIDEALKDGDEYYRIEVVPVDGTISLCCKARIVCSSDDNEEFDIWNYLPNVRESFAKRFGNQFDESYLSDYSYGLDGFIRNGWEKSYRPDFIPDPIEYAEWKASLVIKK